jgi:hypothetical protein
MAGLNRVASWQRVSVSAGEKNTSRTVCLREAEKGKSIIEADQTQLKMS